MYFAIQPNQPAQYRQLRRLAVVALLLAVSLLLAGPLAQAQGNTLTYGSIVINSTSPDLPTVSYDFSGSLGDNVAVQVIGIAQGMAPRITLLAPDQTELAVSGSDPFGLSGDGEARLTVRLPASGTYTIQVTNAGEATLANFVLRLAAQPPSRSAILVVGAPVSLAIPPGSPERRFLLPASPETNQTLTISTSTPDFAFTARVRDTNGRLVAVLAGTPLRAVSITLAASEGNYSVAISALDAAAEGGVSMLLSAGDVVTAEVPASEAEPTEAAPAEEAQPTEAAPEEAAPTEAAPTEAAPTEAAPTEAAPTEVAPEEAQPAATEEITDEAAPEATPTATGTADDSSGTESACTAAVSGSANINVRSGPGTNYAAVGVLRAGESVPVTGRSDDGTWYVINQAGSTGWVAGRVITTAGPCDDLEIIAAPAAPASVPQAGPAATEPVSEPAQSAPAAFISFTIDRATINQGECINLAWETSNAARVVLEGVYEMPLTGGVEDCPAASYTYTLTVTLLDGSETTRTVSVTVN